MKEIINSLSVFTSGNIKNTPIIFVHGFPFDHKMWDEQVNVFKSDLFCITYDIRGLGVSPAGDGQFTIDSFVDDLEIIINELKLNKPILCGLSMGGYISLRAVEKLGENFRAMILCDTKSLADDNAGKINRAAGVKLINEKGVEKFVEQFVPNCFSEAFMNEHSGEFEKVIARSKSSCPIGVKGCLLAMAGRTDTSHYLSEIKIPALLICGEEDSLTPPPVMKSMGDKINNSRLFIVNGAGHMAPLEKPGIVNNEIRKFISELK